MVGGEAERPRARPAGPRALATPGLPPRPARDRRGDEAGRQHADLRAQRGAVAEGLVLAERSRHRPGAGLRRPRRERGRRPVRRLQARRPSSSPTRRPSAFSLALAEKDLRLIAELAEARRRRCRRRASTSTLIRRRRARRRRAPTSRWSPVTCVRRAGDDRSAMRRARTADDRDRPPRDPTDTAHEGTIDDRPNAHQGRRSC